MTGRAVEPLHGADCECPRCSGFTAGNGVALRHGSYALVQLGPRAAELAAAVRATAPLLDDCDDAILGLLGLTLARVEAASAELDKAALADRLRLSADARGWVSTAARLLDSLGCSPAARARLGVDVSRVKASEAQLAGLAARGREARDSREGGGS